MTRTTLIGRFVSSMLCMLALLIAPGFASCCCASTLVCRCAAPEGTSCCSNTATRRNTSCEAGQKCSSSCDCNVNATNDAVVDVTRIDFECEIASLQPTIQFTAIVPDALSVESRGPPILSHNQRQSMLCVWLN